MLLPRTNVFVNKHSSGFGSSYVLEINNGRAALGPQNPFQVLSLLVFNVSLIPTSLVPCPR